MFEAEKKFDTKGLFFEDIERDTTNREIGDIQSLQEYKFMLLREWSLYSSIQYSDYVCSQLRLWTEPGRRDLDKFLALLGIPKEQTQQKYVFMKSKYKEILPKAIKDYAEQFGLKDIFFRTFVR